MPVQHFRRLLPLLLLAWQTGEAAGNERGGAVPVGMEEFIGGTGESAAEQIRAALDRSAVLRVKPGTVETGAAFPASEGGSGAARGGWILRGSSSAGRIDGALLDSKGAVVFNNHYAEPDLRDNACAFADDVVTAITGGRGIASSKIAFVSRRGGRPEIYLADSDGSRVRQVTSGGALKGAPSLGPGAILLAYTSWQSGYADVVMKDLRFGAERAVLNAPGTNSGAAFSFDGSRLALTMSHEGDTDIYISSLTGSRSLRITDSRSVEFSPAWGPDGSRLVFCSDATGAPQLYVVGRGGGEAERLDTGWRQNFSPDWSPDGAHIAFTGRQGGGPSVVLYDLASGRSRVALARAEDPSWAPDGRHLAAVQEGALVVLDTITGKSRVILRGFPGLSEPAWSR